MLVRLLMAAAFLSASASACAHNEGPSEMGPEITEEHYTAPPPATTAKAKPEPLPENPQAAQALYDKGEHLYARHELTKARQAFADLAARYPLDAKADAAKRRIAEIDLAQKHFGDAEQSLKSLYPSTPPAERGKAARQLAEAAEGAGDAVEAVRDWCEVYRNEAASRSDAATALARVVEVELSASDAARLAPDLPSDCPAQESIAYKRALVLAHLGDLQAVSALNDALSRYPNGAAAPRAKQILASLQARASQPVKPGLVGLLVPQSPDTVSAYGKAAIDGLKLALGDGAQLIVHDSKGDPTEAAKAVEELAAQGVQVIVGPILPGESEAAAVKAQELGIPLIALTRAEGITHIGSFVFRNMLTDSAQAAALAHYAIDLRGYKRFAVLYPEVDYGKQMMSLFWDAIEHKGGRFRGAEGYPFDTTTFKSYADRLVGRADLELRRDWREGVYAINAKHLSQLQKKRAMRELHEKLRPIVDFDALFIADAARNVALVAPQLAVENVVTDACNEAELNRIYRTTGEHPKTVALLGWTAWNDPDFDLTDKTKGGHYVECSVFVDGFFAGSTRPDTAAFVSAFQKSYGRIPGLLEAEAYDTGLLVQQALAAKPATRDAFREALGQLKGVKAATGESTVSADREVEKPLFFVTITDKGYEELDLSKLPPLAAPNG
jgi:branched-chain amino acid transport system substrate-binding protein